MDIETDLDSDTDLSPDEETAGVEAILNYTIQSNSFLARNFLENTWSRLYDCENEENLPESDGERVFNLDKVNISRGYLLHSYVLTI